MTLRLLVATVVLAGVMVHPADAQDITIHVFTAPTPGGFVDADSKDRADTVSDLTKALSRKKGIVLVNDENAADLRVEILGRGREETGGTNVRGPFELGPELKPNTEMTIRARLVVGEYQTPMVAQNEPGGLFQSGRWQDLAGKLANQIDRWVRDNRARLLSSRAK